MNDLVGAFILAREKGEDIRITHQSLINSGYSVREIEEAFRESRQIGVDVILPDVSSGKPLQRRVRKSSSGSRWPWILLIIFLILLIGAGVFLLIKLFLE